MYEVGDRVLYTGANATPVAAVVEAVCYRGRYYRIVTPAGREIHTGGRQLQHIVLVKKTFGMHRVADRVRYTGGANAAPVIASVKEVFEGDVPYYRIMTSTGREIDTDGDRLETIVHSERTVSSVGDPVLYILPNAEHALVATVDAVFDDGIYIVDTSTRQGIATDGRCLEPNERVQYYGCVLHCDDESIGSQFAEDLQGGRCFLGHVLCADCTTQYIEKTLLPQGVVWWDRIRCVDPECTEHMEGRSVRRCLPTRLVERLDAAQLEAASMINAEARRKGYRYEREAAGVERDRASRMAHDRASEAYVAQHTKPCPRCGAPSVKVSGCKHIDKCWCCGHEYCWDCGGKWVRGHMTTACAPR